MADKKRSGNRNEASESPSKGATVQTAMKSIQPLLDFWNKFNNDWSWNLSAALAYNLLMTVFPFFTALLAILGIFLGGLSPQEYNSLVNSIAGYFPTATAAQISGILNAASSGLLQANGILWLISIVLAIYYGSRLFVLIENCFGIIYHVHPRKFIRQNIMAIGMLILFIVLIPISIAGSTLTPLLISFLQTNSPVHIPGSISNVMNYLGGLLAAYVLFQVIYIMVPNKKIRFRNSWIGASVAALLLELYVVFFPLYIEHFLTGIAAAVGSAVILLIFFYYFALILLLGAEINAYFAEGVMTNLDLITLVSIKAEKEIQ